VQEGIKVYIFNQTFNWMVIPEYLDPNNLIITPQIINNLGWTKGNFQTVGVQQVTREESELNYGFWDKSYLPASKEEFLINETNRLKQQNVSRTVYLSMDNEMVSSAATVRESESSAIVVCRRLLINFLKC
jgi:hypothetical protein